MSVDNAAAVILAFNGRAPSLALASIGRQRRDDLAFDLDGLRVVTRGLVVLVCKRCQRLGGSQRT